MIAQQTIQDLILAAELKVAKMVTLNLTALEGGATNVKWNKIDNATLGINRVALQYNLGDYSSPNFLKAYTCLSDFVGNFSGGTIDPNSQNPGTVVTIIQTIDAQGTFIRIPFSDETIVSLTNFQADYVPTYGDYAIVTIWVTQDGGATYQQDTGTVPTITNLGGDINKPDSYTWTYPVNTTGYIQVNGFSSSGGNISAGLPITNMSGVPLSDAQLNTLYPASLWGQLVLLPNANIKYTKLDNSPTGFWEYSPYNPNT